ncbi:MAG TPA: 3-hydroxyacyl-CoA dehydrogenase NAD-binding domain-containing protein [Candidatus Acidoferrum sp.]|nr:3-hydroxyacyl-CoA dehydrogenase NAD-binding domain-containing protein [Candidatus Acidoferrum sp.]
MTGSEDDLGQRSALSNGQSTMSENISSIGIVGAGTMGAGIAQVAILSGFRVFLYDAVAAALANGQSRIAQGVNRAVGKGLVQAKGGEDALRRLSAVTQLSEMGGAGIIIEAAPEDLSLKQQLFTELDKLANPAAILATNTSSLSVTAIAGATRRPERVVGMHFFNPVPLMKLVEVVATRRTEKAVVQETVALARRLGKTPVQAKDTPGFIVNRIARHFSLEALRILGEGRIAHEQIDRVMKGAGRFRMGPFELMGLIGIDVNFAVSRSVFETFFQDPRFRPDPIQQRMVESGLLGRKTGHGFYEYPPGQTGSTGRSS